MSPAAEERDFETRVAGVDGSWPVAPEHFSFSSLGDIEGCPRRWALSHAAFASLWDGEGYPERPSVASLQGHVVHSALEDLVRALAEAGCESPVAPEATEVLRQLGGFTEVIRRKVASVLESQKPNPRFNARSDEIRRQLVAAVPQMRQAVQALIAATRIRAVSKEGPWSGDGTGQGGRLPDGSYPEKWVRSSQLKLVGKLDLVTLDGSDVEILDYKTGEQRSHHVEQVRLYAVLWAHQDAETSDRPFATRLTLAYPDTEVDVSPPTPEELEVMRDDVRDRVSSALEDLEGVPAARPSTETCGFCSVRHLCDEYWLWLEDQSVVPGFADLEVELSRPNGPRSWIGRGRGEDWVVVGIADDIIEELSPGQTVRALGLSVPVQDEEFEYRKASLTAMTEIYPLRA